MQFFNFRIESATVSDMHVWIYVFTEQMSGDDRPNSLINQRRTQPLPSSILNAADEKDRAAPTVSFASTASWLQIPSETLGRHENEIEEVLCSARYLADRCLLATMTEVGVYIFKTWCMFRNSSNRNRSWTAI